jgi:regulator of RNase E activity RraB
LFFSVNAISKYRAVFFANYGEEIMKVLHILNDGPDEDAKNIIAHHSENNDVEVVDLTDIDINYDELVDRIEQCDNVISW